MKVPLLKNLLRMPSVIQMYEYTFMIHKTQLTSTSDDCWKKVTMGIFFWFGNRYYPALKTLEQLEHTYLPRISRFRFTQHMCSTIPTIRAQIKEASMSDLKDFLESIRRHCSRVGEAAMVQEICHLLLSILYQAV